MHGVAHCNDVAAWLGGERGQDALVRNVAGAEDKIVEDLRWLGIEWNEGIEVGGPNGPYYQSERLDFYGEVVDRLLAEGPAGDAAAALDRTEQAIALIEGAARRAGLAD